LWGEVVLQLGVLSRRVMYLLATGREPKPAPYAATKVNTAPQLAGWCNMALTPVASRP
jgi:hypothetical protein